MLEENVEIVRALLDAFNAPDMDAFREGHDPDAVWRPADGWPEPGPIMGRDALMRYLEQLRDTWHADALKPLGDFIDAGDRVVVRFIWHGVGYGPESNIEFTGVFTVRKGRISNTEFFFWDHAETLKMMGLAK